MGPDERLRVGWFMLPGQRPWRELHWLSLMPGTDVTAIGDPRPKEDVAFVRRPYRHLTHRFVEAGALAWLQDLASVPNTFDWVASLELCALITGQAVGMARRRGLQHAVLVWGNDSANLLYKLPPYRQALHRTRDADLFLCTIHAAREHCIELGLPAERCEVVHPGVDTELFHPPQSPPDQPVLLFASPLAPNKGIDRVLDAFELARRTVPEARLRVAGRGPLEGLVRERAEATGGAVELLGPLDREGVAAELRGATVFVTAPRPTRVWNEQFGLAYVEAMASGVPVVTTRCGTNHEAVPPPNRLVEDDAEALAEAVLPFLQDPALRREVGATNRSYVLEHHELRRQCERMGEAFRRATRR